jgi:hypothetical protein
MQHRHGSLLLRQLADLFQAKFAIDQERFRGFGCSECGWRFKPSGRPTGKSFDEMMRNFELQRDKAFPLHVCGDHPGPSSTNLR